MVTIPRAILKANNFNWSHGDEVDLLVRIIIRILKNSQELNIL